MRARVIKKKEEGAMDEGVGRKMRKTKGKRRSKKRKGMKRLSADTITITNVPIIIHRGSR